MTAILQSWWQKVRKPLKIFFILIAFLLVIALLVVIVQAYIFNVNVPGLHGKTLWDWLQLLIIPAVLAVGGYTLNLLNTRTEQRIAAQRYQQEQKIAAQRYENDQKIAIDKQREDLLQKYLDCMSDLLLTNGLHTSAVDAEVRNVARVRTITVLFQLDARRIGSVFGFLREAGLMSTKSNSSIINLSQADLSYINLSQTSAYETIFSGADLYGAKLCGADLRRADLSAAFLTEADLSEADLSEANLNGAMITDEQLAKAMSLRGTIMPDGSIHP